MAEGQLAIRQDKYHSQKTSVGKVTHVTMHGTLNEDFIGAKLAATLSKKIVIDMHDVRRFASWGMAEWMEFLKMKGDSDVYLVECSTYTASQLNIVTGLLGHAKLVSFYASYRCSACRQDNETLILIPRDRAAIVEMPNRSYECANCGGSAKLDAYPAAFFETVASRPAFDIDDDVLAFLRANLNYDLSRDLSRFRAFRRSSNDFTYLRLSGNLATLPAAQLAQQSSGITVVDLKDANAEPHQVDAWRSYLTAAAPNVKSLQLFDCPVGFLETALEPGDFGDKLKVRSFYARYVCATCGTWPTQPVDVSAHLEELVDGKIPPGQCPTCMSTLAATVSQPLSSIVRVLPARDRNYALDAFLAKARDIPAEKLENCLAASSTATKPAGKSRTGLYAALAVVVLGAGAAALMITKPWQSEAPAPVVLPTPSPGPPQPKFTRPDWILSDVPGTATCQDLINRYMCVGVSSYVTNKDNGVIEASDAALEELASAVGVRISEPFFKDTLSPGYTSVRAKALSDLQTAELQRMRDAQGAAAFDAAVAAVSKARKRVVAALKASGGAAVPVQWSDWYWEEYVKEVGTGHEFLVYVKYDVPLDAVKSLVEKYSTTRTALGSAVMTAFPELAWQYEPFSGGAVVMKVGPKLAAAGIEPKQLVVGVGDQRVTDATSFTSRVEQATGEVKLTVARAKAPDTTVFVKP